MILYKNKIIVKGEFFTMKRFIFGLFLAVFFICPAFALSDAEYLRMKKDSNFAAADKELTRVYNQARKSLSKEKAEHLKEVQLVWIESERDREANNLIEAQGYSRIAAYTQVTRDRAESLEYITNLIKTEGDYYSHSGAHLEISWQNPLSSVLFAELSCRGEEWIGEGPYGDDFMGVGEYEGTNLTVKFVDYDTIKVIDTNDAFKDSVDFDAKGIYKRRSKIK